MKRKKQSAAKAWKMLILSLPKGIAAFVTVVVGLSVSLPLSVFLIGLPLLAQTFILLSRMMGAERVYADSWKNGINPDGGEGAGTPEANRWSGWKALLSVLGQGRSYRGIAYGLIQFPVGIASFTLAIVLPVTAWAVMLSPLAQMVSMRWFSFDLFAYDSGVQWLLPELSSSDLSWIYAGVGALLVLLMPMLLRMLGRMYAGLIIGIAGPAETLRPESVPVSVPFTIPSEPFREPTLN